MPTVYSSAFFEVNAKNLSSYITGISVNHASEMLDATTMGSSTRKRKGGLLDESFDVNFLYEQSTSGPEAVLWGLVGTTVCVEYRDINVCAATNNPALSGVLTVENFNRTGTIGSLLSATAKFNSFGTISRASSS